MNIVVKLTRMRITENREWHDCVKLSCDKGKTLGNPEKLCLLANDDRVGQQFVLFLGCLNAYNNNARANSHTTMPAVTLTFRECFVPNWGISRQPLLKSTID